MTHYDVFRLAVALLILAALIAAYRTLILSNPANWARDKVRILFRTRNRLPRWKRRLVYLVALGGCRDCGCQVAYRWDGGPTCLEVDHVYPWSAGGSDSIWNLRATCKSCNTRKGARVEAKR